MHPLIYPGNTKGKYHCTVDLLFVWFGISCRTTDNFCFYLQNRLIQTSQIGGQWYSDTFPFSIPWIISGLIIWQSGNPPNYNVFYLHWRSFIAKGIVALYLPWLLGLLDFATISGNNIVLPSHCPKYQCQQSYVTNPGFWTDFKPSEFWIYEFWIEDVCKSWLSIIWYYTSVNGVSTLTLLKVQNKLVLMYHHQH